MWAIMDADKQKGKKCQVKEPAFISDFCFSLEQNHSAHFSMCFVRRNEIILTTVVPANSTKSPTNQCGAWEWGAGGRLPQAPSSLDFVSDLSWDTNDLKYWGAMARKSWQRVGLLKLLMILSNCYGVFQVLQCFLLSEVASTWAHLSSVHKWCGLPFSSFLKALKPNSVVQPKEISRALGGIMELVSICDLDTMLKGPPSPFAQPSSPFKECWLVNYLTQQVSQWVWFDTYWG